MYVYVFATFFCDVSSLNFQASVGDLCHWAKYVIRTSFDVTTKLDVETTLVIACMRKFPGHLILRRDVFTSLWQRRLHHDVVTTFLRRSWRQKASGKLSYTTKYPSSFDVGVRRATSYRVGFGGKNNEYWFRARVINSFAMRINSTKGTSQKEWWWLKL